MKVKAEARSNFARERALAESQWGKFASHTGRELAPERF